MCLRIPCVSAALGALALGGCAALGPVAPPVTPALVAAAHGASAETLTTGRRIFAGKCTACHTADPVGKYTATEWRGIVSDMAARTKLDAAQQSALLAYIEAARGTRQAE